MGGVAWDIEVFIAGAQRRGRSHLSGVAWAECGRKKGVFRSREEGTEKGVPGICTTTGGKEADGTGKPGLLADSKLRHVPPTET